MDLDKRAKRSRQACQALQQPNAAYDAIQRLKAENEALRGRVERMRQAGNRVISYGAPHIEWLTAIDHAIDPSPWLLSKQAEAITSACNDIDGFELPTDN